MHGEVRSVVRLQIELIARPGSVQGEPGLRSECPRMAWCGFDAFRVPVGPDQCGVLVQPSHTGSGDPPLRPFTAWMGDVEGRSPNAHQYPFGHSGNGQRSRKRSCGLRTPLVCTPRARARRWSTVVHGSTEEGSCHAGRWTFGHLARTDVAGLRIHFQLSAGPSPGVLVVKGFSPRSRCQGLIQGHRWG